MNHEAYHINLMMARILVLATATLTDSGAHAYDLLGSSNFEAGPPLPALSAWKIDPQVGGQIKLADEKSPSIVTLTGNRLVDAEGKQKHSGRLISAKRMAVIPGRKYLLEVEARGIGQLLVGMVEFPDPYSPVRLATPGRTFSLTREWKTYGFEFIPSDPTMCISSFFQTVGWPGYSELRNPSLKEMVRPGGISLKIANFVFAFKEPIHVTVAAEHNEIKLLLYGPGHASSGPNGDYEEFDAWTDHFQRSVTIKAAPAAETSVCIDLPDPMREGFYRLVAVDPVTGRSASSGFCVYPKPMADKFRSLASLINLPAGSRLIFLGDSLTDFYRGRNYVDLVARAIAEKHGDAVEVVNAGVGGNTIKQIAQRLEGDVIAKNPTHVFLFEGANDCKRNYDPQKGLASDWFVPREIYAKTYRDVLVQLKERTHARLFVMTTAPGDQRILEPVREQAMAYGQRKNFFCLPEETARAVALQKQIASDLDLPVIDTHDRLEKLLEKAPAPYLNVDDGVHLSEYGNKEVALSILHYLAGTTGGKSQHP